MTTYKPPLRDYRFVLEELLEVGELAKLPGYEDATPEIFAAVLEEGGKFCEEVLLPLNPAATRRAALRERRGAHAEGIPEATTPSARAAGPRSTADPAYGGQGLPDTLNFCLEEMICVGESLLRHVSRLVGRRLSGAPHARQRRAEAAYLPKLVDGTWSRHDVPDRAAMRHRSRPDPHQGRAAAETADTRSPAPRSSSRRASTT